ncbi:hypothetical protein QQP08_025425 [Theobroma cacao]|nr:hypothetical protein QQP08_025425 [Theobroma cacao]
MAIVSRNLTFHRRFYSTLEGWLMNTPGAIRKFNANLAMVCSRIIQRRIVPRCNLSRDDHNLPEQNQIQSRLIEG